MKLIWVKCSFFCLWLALLAITFLTVNTMSIPMSEFGNLGETKENQWSDLDICHGGVPLGL